ncbi:MAG: glycoside hydrolase family 28 protein [Lachnospiraceae bacterium]
MYNVNDYGADSTGKQLSTQAFQSAVDEAVKNGGGVVYVPYGIYLLGTVRLYSNIHIELERGAKLLGSTDLEHDYYKDEHRLKEFYQDNSHSFYYHSLFLAEECEHISITGGGSIDMQGKFESAPRKNDYPDNKSIRGAKVIAFRECKDVVLSDFNLYRATDIAIYLGGCVGVRVHGLYIDTIIDGINPDCCSDTIISDCIVLSGDDGIVPKSSYTLGRKALCENLVITNCVVSSECNAIKLGTESTGGFRNIAISNCVIRNTRQAGLAIECVDGGMIDGVTISNISMNNVGTPILMVLNERNRGPKGTTENILRNVLISHVVANGPFDEWEVQRCTYFDTPTIGAEQYASLITGTKQHKIENVTLSDVHITVAGGATEEMAQLVASENDQGYPSPKMYGELNAYGLFARHVRNLHMSNVTFETLEEDARQAIYMEDVSNV